MHRLFACGLAAAASAVAAPGSANAQAQESTIQLVLKGCNAAGRAKIACRFVRYGAKAGGHVIERMTVGDWYKRLKKEEEAKSPTLDPQAVKTEIDRLAKGK